MKTIHLSRGYVAIVDDEDFERLSQIKWYAHGKKRIYARSRTHGFMHHHVLPRKDGVVPDHVRNEASLDNRKSNLRYLTESQNAFNGGVQNYKGKTSQFRGVHKRKTGWMARITINQVTRSLGVYRTEKEAMQVYELAREAAIRGEQHARFQ